MSSLFCNSTALNYGTWFCGFLLTRACRSHFLVSNNLLVTFSWLTKLSYSFLHIINNFFDTLQMILWSAFVQIHCKYLQKQNYRQQHNLFQRCHQPSQFWSFIDAHFYISMQLSLLGFCGAKSCLYTFFLAPVFGWNTHNNNSVHGRTILGTLLDV